MEYVPLTPSLALEIVRNLYDHERSYYETVYKDYERVILEEIKKAPGDVLVSRQGYPLFLGSIRPVKDGSLYLWALMNAKVSPQDNRGMLPIIKRSMNALKALDQEVRLWVSNDDKRLHRFLTWSGFTIKKSCNEVSGISRAEARMVK